MAKVLRTTELPKPLAGLLFVIFWAIAIVAWSLVHGLEGAGLRGFVADVGIIFASLGVAVPFLVTKVNLARALGLGALGIGLFAIGDFLNIQLLVYTLRLLGPTLAIFTPINRVSNAVKIFN